MSHNDTALDHAVDLVHDFKNHTPAERAHILSGIYEEGASTVLKVAGAVTGSATLDAAADRLAIKANDDLKQGNLNFQDYLDIYKTIDHFV